MDPLTLQRIEEQRSRGMAERLLYALEVMRDGFAIKQQISDEPIRRRAKRKLKPGCSAGWPMDSASPLQALP